ncbi:hypothetical protein niasHS_010088 [Heterodera schachtii]|uniref:Uncharacterized protein n=1 Tax=Heterodera schachtii TaxID=97005 RepID=A0ABD2IYQ1_HETSC
MTERDMPEPNSPLPSKRVGFKEPHTGLVKNDFFGYWYLQYCLVTGLYMLEPWERKMFNVFVTGFIAVLCSAFYALWNALIN